MKQRIPLALLLVAALVSLPGCDREPLVTNTSLPSDKAGNTNPVKPHTPISISYVLRGTLVAGSEIQVDISVSPRLDSRTLDLSMSTSEDLVLSSTRTQFHYQDVAAKAVVSKSVSVVANTDGLHYVHVFANIDTEAGVRTTAFSIPVAIGAKGSEPNLKTNGTMTKEDGDAPVIEMPADVTIRRK